MAEEKKQRASGESTRRNVASEMFPALDNLRRQVDGNIQRSQSRGDYAKAAGQGIAGALASPVVAAYDVGAPVVSTAASFLSGLLGLSGDDTVVNRLPAAPAAPLRGGVEDALKQGRAAPPNPITPTDRIAKFVDSAFRNPLTLRQAQLVAGINPATKAPSAKDMSLAATDKMIGDIYGIELAQARGAGSEEERRNAEMAATVRALNRRLVLNSADPTKVSLADFEAGS